MQKPAERCYCIFAIVRNRFFVNNIGIPEPIRVKFYAETGAQVGHFIGNFGRSRSMTSIMAKNELFSPGYNARVCICLLYTSDAADE